MIERIIILENIDPIVFFGVNNSNIQLLKTLYPKLRLVARGNVIKAVGEEEELVVFEEKIHELEKFSVEMNLLKEEDIIDIVKGKSPAIINVDNLIIHGLNGKPIMARTPNQKRLVDEFDNNDMVFAIGPAGSGKTYTAIALAVRALKTKQVRKIILSRPAVEAGEKLGFLPGDMKEKIDPYLQPLYDALEDMIPPLKLKEYLENKTIQIAPLAFMRGRTLNDAIIILDEAQNTTKPQIKMFLTRLGMNGKMIITGDITQIDLPHSQQSGLIHSMNILRNIKGIGTVEFNKKDIVRHKLVQRIVEAYEKETAAKEKRIVAKKNNEDLNSDEGDDVTNYEMNK
ncbi:MAG: PhoH family protein [Fermentimonas sp.]|nr:PhoH family protein [Fermentimonas sp.]